MSIRPLDLQVLVPKTVDVGKVEQTLKDSNNAQQYFLAAQFQQQLLSDKQKVVKKNKSDHVDFQTDKKDQKQKRQNPKRERPYEEGKKTSRSSTHSHIDITI